MSPPNLYGVSINTTSPTFAPLTDDQAILRQWVTIQFQTKLGFYWSTPEIGCSLSALVLRGLTPDALAAVPSDIKSALEQDERIASVTVAARTTYSAVGSAQLNLTVTVSPKDPSVAPFSFAAVASADIANKTTQGLGA